MMIAMFVDFVSKTNMVDVLLLTSLALAFDLSSFIAIQLSISVAAGAFFAGLHLFSAQSI
jgi:hypothetical protein